MKRLVIGAGVCVVVTVFCVCGVAWGMPSSHPFEIAPGSFGFAPASDQAGGHANWMLSFDFAHEEDGATFNDVRSIVNEFPTGFDASNTAVPKCTEAQLLASNPVAPLGELPDCPVASQIGQISLEIMVPGTPTPKLMTFPVYNMEVSNFGTTAEVGYRVVGLFTQISQVTVRPTDEGLTAVTSNIPKVGEAHNIAVELWGVPAAAEHNAERGSICGINGERPPICRNEFGGPQEARVTAKPFLSNPTSCGSFEARTSAYSWEQPEDVSVAGVQTAPIVECERVPFEPSLEAQPSTSSAESPTGLEVSLVTPQTWENPFTISTSYLKGTTVVLPEGMTANPSLAAGLGACSPEEYERESSSSAPGFGCPPESKIGSIKIETPLLEESIPGAVYIATPYDNPFPEPKHSGGSLIALYIVAKDPQRGLLVKVAGKVTPDPVTGRLTATFEPQPGPNGGLGEPGSQEGLPQQSFSKFSLRFRAGATAPLVSPPVCGSYALQGELTPWSAPSVPRLVSSEPFAIGHGTREGPCPSGGEPPFAPRVVSGTANNAAGSYSPFDLRIEREDGEQEITRFTTTLPPGLTGNLTGIPFCPDAAIEAARQATGAQEEASPSCPAASEIGHTIVEAGVGTVLVQTPGKVYLAGGYRGAPLSIVSITSAKVGPFDLGTVVVRFGLEINPLTAQVEVSGAHSDAIPHILPPGIVVHVRNIHVYMDRAKFISNPTNCEAMKITEAISGAGADPSNPADQQPVAVTAPFQAADCANLAFKPTLRASTSAKASRANGASLTVKLTYPKAPQGTQANIHAVKVSLPKRLPSRLSTLQKACLDRVFEANPAACPVESIVGHAKAITPILPVPLEGPAYFVSHGGAKFPELIIVLQGYGFIIDLHGETFISKTGITSSTFSAVPDEPVSSFELTLPQGQYSALAANGNLCKGKLLMPTTFTGQNNTQIHSNTIIHPTGCPIKHHTHKKKKRHPKAHKKK